MNEAECGFVPEDMRYFYSPRPARAAVSESRKIFHCRADEGRGIAVIQSFVLILRSGIFVLRGGIFVIKGVIFVLRGGAAFLIYIV